MIISSLPLGVRFHPTDVELTQYYLKRKVMGKQFCTEVIADIDIYKYAPWELPAKSCWISKDLEWYFFCPREMKYAKGPRKNRNTEYGFWKTSGNDRPVLYKEKIVGMIKTLIFHYRQAPNEGRTNWVGTNWVMHEYRIKDQDLANAGVDQDAYVICKIFEKSGPGPKNGAQYGAPFNEEDWSDDEQVDGEKSVPLAGISAPASALQNIQESSVPTNTFVPGTVCIGSSSQSTSFKLVQPTENFLRPVNDKDVDMCKILISDDFLSTMACFYHDFDQAANENKESEGLLQNLGDGIDSHNDFATTENAGIGKKSDLSENRCFFNGSETDFITDQSLACEGGSYMELDDLQFPMDEEEGLFVNNESELSPTYTFDDVEHALANNQNSTLPEISNEFHNQLNVIEKADGARTNAHQGYQEYDASVMNDENWAILDMLYNYLQ